MGWFRIELTEEELRVVNAERDSHPDGHVRQRMRVLRLLHGGIGREKAAELEGVSRATVQRFVASFRGGGLAALRRNAAKRPVTALAAHEEAVRKSFQAEPARTVAEAADRIERLTGIRRRPTQVRKFLKKLGMKWQMMRAIPVPPKKRWRSTSENRGGFWTTS